MGWRVLAVTVTVAFACLAAACGDDEEGGAGRPTLTWFIAQQPGGALDTLVDRCTKASDGRYEIELEPLPAQADAQREQLVRRLGAEDESIDIIGMDVVWTGEFANARWIEPVPPDLARRVRDDDFDSVRQTAQFEGRLYGVPLWSNTQLLFYRKDRSPRPPRTWAQMLERAQRLGHDEGQISIQGNRYEGLVVWAAWMFGSAGTSILDGPDKIGLRRGPAERALAVMGRYSRSAAAPDNLTTLIEGDSAGIFESGAAAFMINYPFAYGSARDNTRKVFEQMRAAKLPQVVPGRDSTPPLGGFNLGVSRFSKHGDLAYDAIRCLTSDRSQLEVVAKEGLPPVDPDLFDRPEVRKAYPGFAQIVRESIQDAEPRPADAPAYQDLSLAIQRALHPTSKIDPADPGATYDELIDKMQHALARDGLL